MTKLSQATHLFIFINRSYLYLLVSFLILNPIFCSYLHISKLSQATLLYFFLFFYFYQLELPLSLSEFPHFEPYLSLYFHLFTILSYLSSNFTCARTLSSTILF